MSGLMFWQRIVEIRQLRVRRADEALARLHGHALGEFPLRIAEGAGALR